MVQRKNISRRIAVIALLASVYAAITAALSFLSYGPVQFRVAEGLTVLPYFSPLAIPALFIGCVLSNIISPMGLPDLIFGSMATLIASIITYFIGKSNIPFKKWLAPLPPVVVNALIIGLMITKLYTENVPLYLNMIYVGVGQLICCYGIGIPLIVLIEKSIAIKNTLK
ncbi:Uncharacterized membrane protein [Hathewaya proteolytica DSM 3090]|uniref:Uncharacterized membrane protein n=1 Tax=Hathewaya proteolytica DSM 3090 TaxID=1121331 RepID=A0A1M6SHP3_9CLOT|nr:QueT transporter family protein [Hathewaya proteolytica]SHK44243.1 Uncharacterized membrane protein [Hathewaya proteolytica DSM 3090]